MLWDKVGEAGAEPKALGPLPEWDLADLYPGRDSPELRRDLEALASDAAAFRARYEGSSRRCRAANSALRSRNTSGCRRSPAGS